MSTRQDDLHELTPLQRAALALEKMQARLAAAERARTEPIAVIGMACRFPGGADGVDAYWRMLRDGVDAISEIPKSRWDIDAYYDPEPGTPGKMYGRHGAFLDDVDKFDAAFFGLSPREANSMDPQQRILLEVAWEALESAGKTPARLAGSQTGVFIGVMAGDYQSRVIKLGDPTRFDAYAGMGGGFSFIPGRLSYVLGLEGPSMPVDTACSSSLVAVHLACQSLRSGESRMALAGGVHVILSPEISLTMCSMQALARDGRCKTFDAAADGYVRGEGCGVLVLKRLSDAIADGDNVLAVVRGTAVNHDGASGGLTVPSSRAQQAVIRRALASGNVDPTEVSYVEAHGTGTPLGDPIEIGALVEVLGKGRADDAKIVVGSAKTNIGHLEAAAGMAGLIKVILALKHEEIPPHLNFQRGNPHIPWDRIPVVVPTKPTAWLPRGGTRIAGVSSFGISGTNAHVVLEQAPAKAADRPALAGPARPYVLTLSARSPEALSAMARRYREFLERDEASSLRDVSYTSTVCRAHHEHRLALVGSSRSELIAQLDGFLAGEARPGMVSGTHAQGMAGRVVFIFPGQGSQWQGMGRMLYEHEPVFRASIDACEQAMRAEVDWSLVDMLSRAEEQARWNDVDVVQPMLFAMQVGLAALFRSFGVEPGAVVGHSMGEAAAAHVAGALSLEDAVRIICRRSKLLRRASGKGAMALVELSMEQARAAIRGLEDRLSIAVSNSESSTVLSGDPVALKELTERLDREGVFCRHVKVDVASHSPQMDPLRDDLLRLLAGVSPRSAAVPMISTVTGRPVDGASLDARYWVKNLREPVLFSGAVAALLREGPVTFVELSPHPILLPAIEQSLGHGGRKGVTIASLRRGEDERAAIAFALASLDASGQDLDWQRFYPVPGRIVGLPTYPFQRRRFWIEGEPEGGAPRHTHAAPVTAAAANGAAANGAAHLPAPGEDPKAKIRDALLAAREGEREGLLAAHLREQVALALRVSPSEIDPDRPLNQLGFDSILAMEMKRRVEGTLNVPISVVQFLRGASIGELAKAIGERLVAETGESDGTTVTPRSSPEQGAPRPLSHAQRAIWLLSQLSPESPAYNIFFAGRVVDLDVEALRRAFQALLDRHEILRTTYLTVEGEPRALVRTDLKVPFEVTDASALGRAELDELVATEGDRPFDLVSGPMIRARVFRLASDEVWLSFTLHHIAVDLWSFDLLVADLRALYRAERGGPPVPELAADTGYADFVRWQVDLVAGPRGERQWAYWKDRLSGELPLLDLPTDKPRPPAQTFRGAAHVFTLSEPLSRALKELARAEGTTLYTVLLTGLAILLQRYTGQHDLLIGAPLSGRSESAFERLTGCFVNTVVLRADLSGDPTPKALIAQLRDRVLEAIDNQDLPFPLLVERLQPARDASRSPLFQVMFAWEQSRFPQTAPGDLDLNVVEVDSSASGQRGAPFDLLLMMSDGEPGIPGALRYNVDLFDRETIERMVGHLTQLLERMVARPDGRVSALSILSEAERARLLVEWNDTRARAPDATSCVHELIEAQVERTPDAIAVVDGHERLTYRELSRRSNQLANYLRARGVGPEVLVGIAPSRSVQMIVGILGVLKAGGAYVPLDPAYPRDRIEFMLADTQASVLLTHDRHKATLPASSARVVCLDADWPEVAAESDVAPRTDVGERSLAYVIYTSGSTGRPKGVAIEHRSAALFLRWATADFSLDELRGVLASTSICFDLSIFEMFAPLCCGGQVIVAENALALVALPCASDVTLLNTVPSAMTELLRLGAVPSSVRVVNLAGEPLKPTLARDIYALGHVEKLYNLYGPTEYTTYATFTLVARDADRVTIGRPLPRTQVYVVDSALEPVPIGVPGEVYIAGEGLARGYLNRPDLTEARFVSDPFSDAPGARMYRTGDLARRLPNGELDYLGRIDHQVKVRGYRIELGEIESRLLGHPNVREVVVVVREDQPGDKRIVAYLSARPGTELGAIELQAYLREHLPEFMVPSTIVILDALPLTPNGKIDRRALPAPAVSREALASVYVAPQSGLEESIASVWQEVLRIDRVGVDDNFFDLGGHSLLLVQVHGKLTSKLGVQVPVVDLFQHPTVASLARHLSKGDVEPTAIRKAQERARKQRERMTPRRPAGQEGRKNHGR